MVNPYKRVLYTLKKKKKEEEFYELIEMIFRVNCFIKEKLGATEYI